MSCLVFGQSLPDAAQTNLTKPYLPKKVEQKVSLI